MATETNDLVEFIRSVPKAELHLHIEVRAWVCGAAAGEALPFAPLLRHFTASLGIAPGVLTLYSSSIPSRVPLSRN